MLTFAENNLEKNSYTSFLSGLNTTLTHLQEQDTLSHKWLNQYQKNGQSRIFIFDGDKPIYYQQYHQAEYDQKLIKEATDTALDKFNIDFHSPQKHSLTEHKEFTLTTKGKDKYYASVGTIPKGRSHLGFIILYSLKELQVQKNNNRIFIIIMDIAAYLLFAVFSWYFTKRMIIPLSESQKKQTIFIASASHELRAPLAVLRSGLEVLKKTDDINEQEHFLKLMTDESDRMKNLIDDMLLLANADSDTMPMHMKVCQLDSLMLDVFEKFEAVASKKKYI